MNPKRLLIAAEIFPPAIGGPATYAATLARELPPRGWHVTVVCYADQVTGKYPATIVPVPRWGGPALRYWRYFRTLWKLARNFPVIYAQGPVSSGLSALVVAKLRRKKLVVKVTGDYAWEQAFRAGATKEFIEPFQRQRAGGKYGALRFIERLVCRNADAVVAPSEFLKKIIVGWGVKAAKASVIYNAPSFPVIVGDKAQVRSELHIPVDFTLVVSVGRPVPWKGFGALGCAVVKLIAEGSNVRLVCLGVTDVELRELMAQAGGKPLPPGDSRLTGKGVVGKEELMAWLRAADCLVLNTAYEGLSHIILEAMHAGTPVITTDVGGNRELIRHGETGMFVPYNDVEKLRQAIADLMDNSGSYGGLAIAAARELERFSLPAIMEATVRLLLRV